MPQLLPPLALLAQHFEPSTLGDPALAARQELKQLNLDQRVSSGQSVAITAGSRNIASIAPILASVIRELKALGAKPFIFPAMGSHGGGTDQGQAELLASFGIDPASMGAPVNSSMATVLLGETAEGIPVHCDALAASADHVVVVNRVKAHTKFKGEIESGLMKMLAVGMGKHEGARALHRLFPSLGMERVIVSAARLALAKLPVLLGLGIVENGLGQVHALKAFHPRHIEAGEKDLLELAKTLAPRIPFPELDLLVVDRMGKDVSGTGMDTNVTGRNRDILGDFCVEPRIKRILVRDLSKGSHGNALGIGFADFTTQRLVSAMDVHKTVTNALAAMSPEKAAVPIALATDREALIAALDSLGAWSAETVKMARIFSTARLEYLYASPALLKGLRPGLRVISAAAAMEFDHKGNLVRFPDLPGPDLAASWEGAP